MLKVVTFLWNTPGYRSSYTAEHVQRLAKMVEEHYAGPYTFVCFSDQPPPPDVRFWWLPIWDEHADIPNPTWPNRGPSCYRRLKLFKMFNEPFVVLDLDIVITGDLAPLWNRPEPCVTYRPPGLNGGINGAMWLVNEPERFRFVWDLFDPATSPAATKALGYRGSDQAWLTACLQHCSAQWGLNEGLYEYGRLRVRRGKKYLPDDARIVFFHGKPDPWECDDDWIVDKHG